MEIIPAIDIIDGKCVRLTHGDYNQKKIYNEHPLEVARRFEDAGLKRLHLVDLDGAKDRCGKNWNVLETLATKTNLVIDFGGGIKTEKDVQIVFECGSAYATVGSMAVKEAETFTAGCKNLVRKNLCWVPMCVMKSLPSAAGPKQPTSGFTILYRIIHTKACSSFFVPMWRKMVRCKARLLSCTKTSFQKFPELYFIASGGVSNIDDVYGPCRTPAAKA
jgi:phosphoribosylformimino-5-aminoimidazole carboxamide ribotide isomerase